MIVAIDAGNSRIKWGLHAGGKWVDKGVLATADVARLAEVAEAWPAAARGAVCNVAGPAVAEVLRQVLAGRRLDALWLQASARCCGVENRYEQPGQLGADRWAALIGARGLVAGACLVVCAGTATTVDLLDAGGVFRGGVILPGFDLMRAALARNTAQLPLAEGEFRLEPRNTMDAIVSGCLLAQVGAIEHMYGAIADAPDAVCVLTGGAAARLVPQLGIPLRQVDNLVLEGLLRLARSGAAV